MPATTDLGNLHDIVTPALPSWLPPAPAWYVIGSTALIIFIYFGQHRYMTWRRNKYRRQALLVLREISTALQDNSQYAALLPRLPELVKRTAIAAFGRRMTASLNGLEWLAFLNRTGGAEIFSGTNGKLLLACSCLSDKKLASFTSIEVNDLQKSIGQWLTNHQMEMPHNE